MWAKKKKASRIFCLISVSNCQRCEVFSGFVLHLTKLHILSHSFSTFLPSFSTISALVCSPIYTLTICRNWLEVWATLYSGSTFSFFFFIFLQQLLCCSIPKSILYTLGKNGNAYPILQHSPPCFSLECLHYD